MPGDSAGALRRGLHLTGWGVSDLWVAAVAIGGALSHSDVGQITSGERFATPAEHDVLAAAFNDHFAGSGEDHPVSYWSELQPP